MAQQSLRTLLKRRARLRWKAFTSKRGLPLRTFWGWYWDHDWMHRLDRTQKKPKPSWRRL